MQIICPVSSYLSVFSLNLSVYGIPRLSHLICQQASEGIEAETGRSGAVNPHTSCDFERRIVNKSWAYVAARRNGTVKMSETPRAIFVSFNQSVPMSSLTNMMRPDIIVRSQYCWQKSQYTRQDTDCLAPSHLLGNATGQGALSFLSRGRTQLSGGIRNCQFN